MNATIRLPEIGRPNLEPACAVLDGAKVWPPRTGHVADLALREWLRPLLQDEVGLGQVAYDTAWDRWMLLIWVERYRLGRPGGRQLLVVHGHEPTVVSSARWLSELLWSSPDSAQLLSSGMLGGRRDVALQALEKYTSAVGKDGDDDGWRNSSADGDLHTGRRYIGRPSLEPPRFSG